MELGAAAGPAAAALIYVRFSRVGSVTNAGNDHGTALSSLVQTRPPQGCHDDALRPAAPPPTAIRTADRAERELAMVRGLLLRDDVPLLTRPVRRRRKTRLAVRVASDLEAKFPDGVVFVDLAPITDPDCSPLPSRRPWACGRLGMSR